MINQWVSVLLQLFFLFIDCSWCLGEGGQETPQHQQKTSSHANLYIAPDFSRWPYKCLGLWWFNKLFTILFSQIYHKHCPEIATNSNILLLYVFPPPAMSCKMSMVGLNAYLAMSGC